MEAPQGDRQVQAKRRRSNEQGHEDAASDGEGGKEDEEPTSTPMVSAPLPIAPAMTLDAQLRKLYRTIEDAKDDDGRQLCEIFLELPDRDEYPDYYAVIHRPICLEEMFDIIEVQGYRSLGDFRADFSEMVSNAKSYNEDESQVYEDAVILQSIFERTYVQLTRSNGGSSPEHPATPLAANAGSLRSDGMSPETKTSSSCPICGKVFSRSTNMYRHWAVHTSKTTQPSAAGIDDNGDGDTVKGPPDEGSGGSTSFTVADNLTLGDEAPVARSTSSPMDTDKPTGTEARATLVVAGVNDSTKLIRVRRTITQSIETVKKLSEASDRVRLDVRIRHGLDPSKTVHFATWLP